MNRRVVDARGKACPRPVIETRQAFEDPAVLGLEVIVDNDSAAENVARTGRQMGCEVRLETVSERELHVLLDRSSSGPPPPPSASPEAAACGPAKNVVCLIAADRIGEGDPELGRILMLAFVKTLKEVVPRPKTMIFVNSGVKLTTEGSELLAALGELAQAGTIVLSCGTCLDFYELKSALRVGAVSNMLDIVSTLVAADRVIRP